MSHVLQSAFLASFTCLGDRCEDTCCKSWTMQVDSVTRTRYEAYPELIQAVEGEGVACHMRRDPVTDYCVKLEQGLCGVQKKHGADFLSDACYFYPRITRRLGDRIVMSATPSCPEIARLALFGEVPFQLQEMQASRLPQEIKNYLPEGLSSESALQVHHAFMDVIERANSVEEALAKIISAAYSLAVLPAAQWEEASLFYLQYALPLLPPEMVLEDPFNVLHALAGIAVSTHTVRSERFMATVTTMEHALGATLQWETMQITVAEDAVARYERLIQAWHNCAADYDKVLKRWLQLQLAGAFFPFGGLGNDPVSRITIIAVRFATLRLALICETGSTVTPCSSETLIRIVQSLARILDHLSDWNFAIKAYEEAGWCRERRLRGLCA